MSETNQEDLSVEDILSSIKNILVDENGEPANPGNTLNAVPEVTPQPVAEPAAEKEDIFNLDASMIINETTSEPDITQFLSQTATEEPVSSLADSIDIQQTLDMAEKIDLSAIPALDDILPHTEPHPAPKVDDEVIDASAGIINNFARVFAEKQQEQAKAGTAQTAIADSISTEIKSANIDGLIKQTIVSQIKTNIDTHFERLVSDIVAAQTREWLNQNLASIVEKTVAKEIERVIAKVG